MKKKKILSLLILSPLLMANSPAPFAYPDEYKDFTYTFVDCTNISDDIYLVEYILTNKGDGFIKLDYSTLEYKDDIYQFIDLPCDLLAPSSSINLSFYSEEQFDNTSEISLNCLAFEEVDRSLMNITFIDTSSIYKTSYSYYDDNNNKDETFTYKFYVNYDKEEDPDYFHSLIYRVTYLDNEYYFYSYSLYSHISFSTTLDMKTSDIKIDDFIAVRGRKTDSDNVVINEETSNVIASIILFIAIFNLASLFIGGLGGLIFLFIFIHKKRKAKR